MTAAGPRKGRPTARAAVQPPPLLPRQARGMLAGLGMFAIGFAVAGVLVAAALGGTPAYWIAISIGLVGIGVVGGFSPRGLAEAGRPPVWSRRGLAAVSSVVGLPARAVTGAFYALVVLGVAGNLLVPLVFRRR